MVNHVELMMKLIKSEVCGTALDIDAPVSLSEEDGKKLYSISKAHDLAHIVGSALAKNKISLDKETEGKFQKQTFTAVYRYENINYEYNRICDTLESAGIPFIPLKGSVIRKYYAEPWMRTSCDIDILVHEEELDRAAKQIVDFLGYTRGEKGQHDISLHSSGGVHIELHYSLIEDDAIGEANKILLEVWDFAKSVDGALYHCELRDEMFYYYHIAHMAKHFVLGGCGVRPFLDICVLNNKLEYDTESRYEILARGGLSLFARSSEELCEVWFGNAEHTEVTAQMQEYLLGAGVYGNMSNKIAVEQGKKGGKLNYAMSRIWLPYEVLRFHYPSLEKHRRLLLFYEIRRWGKLIFCGGLKRSVNELSANRNMSSERVSDTADLIQKVGL